MSALDLKAVEALEKLEYESPAWRSALRTAAPGLLALAKIGLQAIDWLSKSDACDELTPEASSDSMTQACDLANSSLERFRALVTKHQSGGGG